MSFQEFKEHNVRAGLGTALCYMRADESKYHILCAVESLPAVFGSQETIEYSTTTNRSVTQVPAKRTTESIEIELAYNIDNISIMNDIKDEKIKYAYIDLDDFSGQEFVGVASYRMADVGTDDIKKLVLNIAVVSAEDTITMDLYDLFMDTITFDDNIPSVIVLAVNGTQRIKIATSEEATPTVTSEAEAIATASFGSGVNAKELTITGVANGSTIVKLEASKEGYASNKREIKVIVK